MKLEHLKLGGFNHFNVRTVLNCVELPDGLIAIVGPNGSGKTTMLDAGLASLYGAGAKTRAFPSREGPLAEYATARDAFIDATWSLDGHGAFRARTNVDGERRVTDAVLEQLSQDGRLIPLNDGKTSTFREKITALFPSQQSVLASAFASQSKRGSFGELSQTDRLALFRELADLSYLQEKSDTAKRCQQITEGIASQIRAALDVLRRDATPDAREVLVKRLTALAEDERRLVADRADFAQQLTEMEQTHAQCTAAAKQHAVVSARVIDVRQSVIRAQSDVATHVRATGQIQTDYDATLARLTQQRDRAVAAIERRRIAAHADHDRAQKDRQSRIDANRTLLAKESEIRCAMAETRELEWRMTGWRHAEQSARQKDSTLRVAVQLTQQQISEMDSAARELDSARRRAGLLGTVKFGEACGEPPVCPLVTDAVGARTRVAELEIEVAKRADAQVVLDCAMAEQRGLVEIQQSLARQIADAERQILDRRVAVQKAPYLDAAQERITEYERDSSAAETAHLTALDGLQSEQEASNEHYVSDCTLAAQTRAERVECASRESVALSDTLRQAHERVMQAEIEMQQTAHAQTALDRVEEALRTLRQRRTDVETTLARLAVEHEMLTQQRADLERRLAEADAASRRVRVVEDEGLAWAVLAKACGRDGLQRLEIDAAGPVVSDLANQLLRVGYGTRFSVEIVTQIATAKGDDMKEKFTILAIDNEHGGEARDVGDLSGGERVIVEEAIRAALSCYVNLRSRHHMKTIWRDETTGALDPENAPRYVAMLRKLHELSGAEQILFVTHSPECASLADAQVRVRDGQATIALPPFSEAS